MKSIKEKAIETERNTHPLFESIKESTGEPVSVYDQDDMISMFEQGANYVLEQIEQLIYEKHIEGNLPLFDLTHLIDELKEK